jgi:predicted CoA-binding protein
MGKNSLTTIEEFLAPKRFAFIGLSRDPKKFSRSAFKELKAKGFDMFPVNPNLDEIDGTRCYKELSELPDNVKHALFMTPKENTAGAVENAIHHGFTHLWIQQGSETKEALEIASQNGVKLVSKTCILMHGNPSGIHKFHGFIMKLFGGFPKK